MARISWKAENDFSKSTKYIQKLRTKKYSNLLMKYADKGVEALKSATPKDSGFTAQSWYAVVVIGQTYSRIYWHNSHIEQGKKGSYPIAILIDTGHGTGTGGYVKPDPYIDDALKPIMEELSDAIRKEVLS